MTLAAVLVTTKIAAALAFFGVLLVIGVAYRLLARRLESERADAVLEAEFARLDAEADQRPASGGMQPQPSPSAIDTAQARAFTRLPER